MSTPQRFVPFAQPSLGEEEIAAVSEVLRSGWLTIGPRVREFEAAFAKVVQCKSAVALNSGTAALHLSLLAKGIGQGDEVITTPFTFASTANVIVLCGATPVFVDIEPSALNIDPRLIEKSITDKTKALLVVHFAGRPCALREIREICARHQLLLIEDATHALGSFYEGVPIGAVSDFAAFSFYPTKNITAAEGGMAVANASYDVEQLRALRWYGLSEDISARSPAQSAEGSLVAYAGLKYNMNDLQAAIGLVQLTKLSAFNETRRRIASFYDHELGDIDEIELPPTDTETSTTAHHLYVIRLRTALLEMNRRQFCEALRAKNVGSSYHYPSLHRHPYYQKVLRFTDSDLPVASEMTSRVVSLPIYPSMSGEDMATVVDAVRAVVGMGRSRRTLR